MQKCWLKRIHRRRWNVWLMAKYKDRNRFYYNDYSIGHYSFRKKYKYWHLYRDDVTISKVAEENFTFCIFQDSNVGNERCRWLEILRGQENWKSEFLIGNWTFFFFFFIWKLKLERDWNLKIENAGDWKSRSMEILKWKISGKRLGDIYV